MHDGAPPIGARLALGGAGSAMRGGWRPLDGYPARQPLLRPCPALVSECNARIPYTSPHNAQARVYRGGLTLVARPCFANFWPRFPSLSARDSLTQPQACLTLGGLGGGNACPQPVWRAPTVGFGLDGKLPRRT